MTDEEKSTGASRRSVLSTVAGTGATAALGALASRRGDAGATVADSLDELLLGTFESTLDGWRADGDVALSRIGRDDLPAAVTEGEHALDVDVDGESAPAISRSVSGLDLATRPYFVADAVPGRVDGTNDSVAFRFRLYRSTDLLDGDSTDLLDGDSTDLLDGGSPAELVAESAPVTVPQAAPGRIYWDASDVELDLLDAVSRVEIAWHPVGKGPESSDEPFEYRGRVGFDAVRATDSVDPVGGARLAATMRDLQFDHGAYVRTEVREEFDGGEAGKFVFADGGTETYRFETVGADRFLLTVADAEIEFGAGWS